MSASVVFLLVGAVLLAVGYFGGQDGLILGSIGSVIVALGLLIWTIVKERSQPAVQTEAEAVGATPASEYLGSTLEAEPVRVDSAAGPPAAAAAEDEEEDEDEEEEIDLRAPARPEPAKKKAKKKAAKKKPAKKKAKKKAAKKKPAKKKAKKKSTKKKS